MIQASKLAARLENVDPQDEADEGLLNFVVGAVYSAAQCERLGVKLSEPKEPSTGLEYIKAVKAVARDIAEEKGPPSESPWLPLYFFNNALFRTDVCFERVAQRLVGGALPQGIDEIKARVREKQPNFPQRYFVRWALIRQEVNNMKHKSPQLLKKRRVHFKLLLKSINDLLSAVNWLFTALR